MQSEYVKQVGLLAKGMVRYKQLRQKYAQSLNSEGLKGSSLSLWAAL